MNEIISTKRTHAWIFLCAFFAAGAGAADLQEWEPELDRIEAEIARADGVVERSDQLREDTSAVVKAAHIYSAHNRDEAIALRDLLSAIGAPPAEGEVEESTEIKKRRREINLDLGQIDSQIKRAELVVRRGESLLEKLSTASFERLRSSLLTRTSSPINPQTWFVAARQLVAAVTQLRVRGPEPGMTSIVMVPVLALLVVAAVLVGKFSRRLLARFGRDSTITAPNYSRRVLAAVVVGLSRGLLPALAFAAMLLLTWTYYLQYTLPIERGDSPLGLFGAVIFYILASAFVRAAFAPSRPEWRIVPVKPEAAVRIGHRLHLFVAGLAINIAAIFVFSRIGEPEELASVHTFAITAFVAAVLLSLTSAQLWQVAETSLADDAADGQKNDGVAWTGHVLRFLVVVAALTMLIGSILGYRLIADVVRQSTVSTILVVALFVAGHVLVNEALAGLLARDSGPAAEVKRLLSLSDEGAHTLNFWLAMFADLALLICGAVVVLAVWGVPISEMGLWLNTFAQGIQIGPYSFSLIDFVLAFVVFVIVIASTRLVQRFFEKRLLPQTRFDIGVRTAIGAGIGYLGLTIAALLAISMLGIDLTKLALVAGALSVGIGFGLQNIVNNFVSGLILLVERPVKIGDWVVIGDIEGKIRKINVRSTLIETFNRADVIIPNANLLQSALVNWTHKNRTGRLDIAVGVAYSSDIECVEEVLLRIAEENSKVLRWPEPKVIFSDFGSSSLDFELRVFVADIEERWTIASDIRKAIIHAFRAADIEIPFPQRDLWVRELPGGSLGK